MVSPSNRSKPRIPCFFLRDSPPPRQRQTDQPPEAPPDVRSLREAPQVPMITAEPPPLCKPNPHTHIVGKSTSPGYEKYLKVQMPLWINGDKKVFGFTPHLIPTYENHPKQNRKCGLYSVSPILSSLLPGTPKHENPQKFKTSAHMEPVSCRRRAQIVLWWSVKPLLYKRRRVEGSGGFHVLRGPEAFARDGEEPARELDTGAGRGGGAGCRTDPQSDGRTFCTLRI